MTTATQHAMIPSIPFNSSFYITSEKLLTDVEAKIQKFVNEQQQCDFLFAYSENDASTTFRLILTNEHKEFNNSLCLLITNNNSENSPLVNKIQAIAEKHNLFSLKTIVKENIHDSLSSLNIRNPETISCIQTLMNVTSDLLSIIEVEGDSPESWQNNQKKIQALKLQSDAVWNNLVTLANSRKCEDLEQN